MNRRRCSIPFGLYYGLPFVQVIMSLPQDGSSGYFTPPPSPKAERFDFPEIDLEFSKAKHNEFPANGHFFVLPKRSMFAGYDGNQDCPDTPPDLTRNNSVVSRSPESPGSPIHRSSSPILNVRSSSSSPDPFRCRPALRTSNTGSSGSIRSPDRFLPTRSPLDTCSQRFHANQDVTKLSGSQRLLRRDTANDDAFSSRRRATTPNPITATTPTRQITGVLRTGGDISKSDC